jgi:hypothetical protein
MATAAIDSDVALARRAGEWYCRRGYNPLPSRRDAKRPPMTYAHLWEVPIKMSLWDHFPEPNVQVMTGRRWKLAVVDLDGEEAIETWRAMTSIFTVPRTWKSAHAPTTGGHIWFGLPEGMSSTSAGRKTLWEIPGEKHKKIELLGDRCLITAPPSRHVVTGRRYRWLKGHSPRDIPTPAPAPHWLLAMPDIREIGKKTAPEPELRPVPSFDRPRREGMGPAWRDVLATIPDFVALAELWGVRFASREPNHAGWCACHCISRPDRHPSASFSPVSGAYWEPGLPKPISFFQLGVELGKYRDFHDAVMTLGEAFGVEAKHAG